MRSKEDLFQLVKSMSRSEKRYFTLDAQKSGKKASKYLELFQVINAMESHDEKKLKKKFPRNLPFDKAYLYEAILRSMRDYRSVNSRLARIKEKILDSKFLYERGLYRQCEERLKEAKEMAELLDDQLALLEINKEERRLFRDTKRKIFEAQLENLLSSGKNTLEIIQEEAVFIDLYDWLFIEAIKYLEYRDTKQKETLQKKIPKGLLHPENEPVSPSTKRRYFQCNALYHQLLGDFEKVYHYFSQVVYWWDTNAAYKEEEFARYIVDISNLLHVLFTQEQLQYIPEFLKKLESEIPSNMHDQKMVFQKVSLYKLMYYINTGISDGVDKLVADIDTGLNHFNINPGSRMVLQFNMAVLLFVLEDFERCKSWSKKIIRGVKTELRLDIQKGVHVLNLISSYEIDEPGNIESTYRSTQRFLNKFGKIREECFEAIMLDSIRKLISSPMAEYNRIYIELEEQLLIMKANPRMMVALGLDDLIMAWVQSKLTHQPIRQFI
ncbi:MAG: hypothetical protein GY705_30870 [Bacteroidetes bacterium]|nr:hypothetical protein [Bacteroidota bacterium]